MAIGRYLLLFIFVMQMNSTLSAEFADLKIKLPSLKTSMGTLGEKLKDFSQKLDTLKASLHTLKKTKKPTGPVGPFDKTLFDAFRTYLDTHIHKETKQLDEKILKTMAETNGYGYKTSNLQLMEELIKNLNAEYQKTGFSIKIPELCGISSQEIQDFLLTKLNINIPFEWGKVIAGIDAATAKKAFENNKFPPDFVNNLRLLEEKINQEFIAFLKELTTKKIFEDTDFPGFKAQTIHNLNNLFAKFPSSKFMVRSTAKEDTAELANAGGNESVANVPPTVYKITNALRIVVASYFGPKSSKQRLGAPDPSLFDPKPFTPALIQLMIGERQTKKEKWTVGKIPACGVMFTEEAEGGISKNFNAAGSPEKDRFNRIKTTGITFIQAAYGHNEGVVNSIVAVDSYYIDDTGEIFPLLRQKNFRMAPKDSGTLGQVENPELLKTKSALTFPAVYALKLFAMTLEHYYKKPMDVEFVVDYDANTLYIVQARPIVHNKKQPKASYLKEFAKEFKPASVIGAAGGALQLISHKDQIIIKTRLPEALSFYQNEELCDPKKIKCIVVKEMAPATSHEATTFRSELKPVLACDSIDKIEDWVSSGKTIIVDTQQGVIRTYDGPSTTVDELIGEKIAAEGWIQYPVPQLYSVKIWDEIVDAKLNDTSSNKDLFGKNDQASVKNIIAKLNDKDTSKELPLKAIIKTIKTGITQDAKCNLEALIIFYGQAIKKAQDTSKDKSASFFKELKLWNRLFFKTALYVDSLLKFPSGDTDNFSKRLFAINFLEALLKQQSVPLSLDISSFATYQSGLQKIKGNPAPTRTGTPDEKDHVAGLMLAAEYASDDTIKNNWKNFIKQTFSAATLEKTKKSVLTVVGQLSAAGIFPLWLNMTFKNPQTSDVIIKEYQDSLNYFQDLAEKMKKLESFNVALFEDPEKFDKLWKIFETEFLNFFNNRKCIVFPNDSTCQKKSTDKAASTKCSKCLDKGFIDIMQNTHTPPLKTDTPDLVKVYGAILMDAFVDKFDSSIKAVKGSSKFEKITIKNPSLDPAEVLANPTIPAPSADPRWQEPNKNKIINFNKMVHSYFNLLEMWLPLGDKKLKYHGGRDNTIQTIKKSPPFKTKPSILFSDEKQLQPSATFNVSAAIIGNGQDFVAGLLPQRLEDLFTMSHQSLLNVISSILQPFGEKIQKPKLLAKVLDNLTSLSSPLKGLSLTGFNFSSTIINYFYNYPLRQHSGKITVTFNKKNKTTTFSMSIVGNDEQGRFHKVADFTEFAAAFYGYESAKFPAKALADKGAVNFSWTLTEDALLADQPIINLGLEDKTQLESIAYSLQNSGTMTYCTYWNKEQTIKYNIYYEDHLFSAVAPERKMLTHNPLISKAAEQIRAAQTIIELSLKKDRAHWLLPKALNILTLQLEKNDSPTNQALWKNLITILENLYSNKKRYDTKSELFLFRKRSDPRGYDADDKLTFMQEYANVPNILFIGTYYYTITDDNYLIKKAEIEAFAKSMNINLKKELFEDVYKKAILAYLTSVKLFFNTQNTAKFNNL